MSTGAGRAGAPPAGRGRGGAGRRRDPAPAPSRTCSRPGGRRPGLCGPALHCCGGWRRGAGRARRHLCVSLSPRRGARKARPRKEDRPSSPQAWAAGLGGGGTAGRDAPAGRGRMMGGLGTGSTGRPTPDHREAPGPGGGELCSWGRRAGGGPWIPRAGRGSGPARAFGKAPPAKFTGARAYAGPAEIDLGGGPARAWLWLWPWPRGCSGDACRSPGALRGLPAGLSLPAAAAGYLLGPRFANRNTPSKTGHRREKWPRIPLLGSPFKATGLLSQGLRPGGQAEGGGMKIPHWLIGAEKCPRPPHPSALQFPPTPFPPIPRGPGLLTDLQS